MMSECGSQNTGTGEVPEGGKRKAPTQAVDATGPDPMLKALAQKEKASKKEDDHTYQEPREGGAGPSIQEL